MKRVASLFFALILVVTLVPASLPNASAAVSDILIGFEDGQLHGLEPNDGGKLTITSELASAGKNSLLISERTKTWNGAQLRIDKNIKADTVYIFSIRARIKGSVKSAAVWIATEVGPWPEAVYRGIGMGDVTNTSWALIRGQVSYSAKDIATGYIKIEIGCDDPATDFYIDEISFMESAFHENIIGAARLPSLKDIYKDSFLLGNGGVSPSEHVDVYVPFARHNFDLLVLHTYTCATDTKDKYDFSSSDKELEFIERTGAMIHGHPLIWHETNAAWLTKTTDDKPLTRAEAKSNMEKHINAIAGRYAGKIISWDVLNEAVRNIQSYNGNWRDALRSDGSDGEYSSPWYMAYENGADKSKGEQGSDYVYDAFVFARKADPNATLYYNDYGMTGKAKAAAVADMVKELNTQWKTDKRNTEPNRPLIEGVGDQAHNSITTDLRSVEESIQILSGTGVEFSITELDAVAIDWGTNNDFSKVFTPELEKKQADFYAKLFQLYNKYSDEIARVTFWGVCDLTSWVAWGYPCLFDENHKPKLAYFAVADPEGYLAGNFNTEAKRKAWIEANSLPVQPPADNSPVTASPTASTVYVNGKQTGFDAYKINNSNYFKLRDLAAALNGTNKQFEVGYDSLTKTISLISGKPYTSVGGEMAKGDGTNKTAAPTVSKIYLDGKELNLTVYTIGGNNFFKLRDLMQAIDVYVGYDNVTEAITLDTNKPY